MANTTCSSEIFGTLLGTAPGGVEAYSSDYDSVSQQEYPKRSAFRSYYDGIYMGHKWQCVEFARRWLYINYGYIFDDVAMAYDIFDLRSVRNVQKNSLLPLQAFTNGCQRSPEPGCLLIWKEGGEFERTGHVAIITEVSADYVRIAEQNVGHQRWGEGRDYARELHAKRTPDGEYWITCSYGDAEILGWMIQTDDTQYAEITPGEDPALLQLKSAHNNYQPARKSWLNVANHDEAAFVDAMGGHGLSSDPSRQDHYFILSRSAEEQLAQASNDLHELFMHATDYVLANDELLAKFNLPESILPRIRQSWDNRLNEVITSRFDFAITPEGLKVYEYNCDSASCYMEAGRVQGKWFDHRKIDDGHNGGRDLFAGLVKAWQRSKASGLVHILRDDDPEETYHALFMQEAINKAGLRSKVLIGVDQLHWNKHGEVVDEDGENIRWVWKTWAWETALDQIRELVEGQQQVQGEEDYEPQWQQGNQPQLSDVLFRRQVMVFEPLWTLIPSNKAILPVLWSLFPNHPLLLEASFELEDSLKAKGYVEKPIVGRCGANISLFDNNNKVVEQTSGQFEQQDMIYQQFFPLPQINDLYVQISTFMTAGVYAGSGVRVDQSRVINKDSDCLPLLIVKDKQFLAS
ncbi:MAG: bifunctional glutathionylspermidine amidase/synthase [Parahaliea sp.]